MYVVYRFLRCCTRVAFSTNFYRAGAPNLPISTAPAPPFYQFLPVSTAPRSPFYPKKNRTNRPRGNIILPIYNGRLSKFYQFLPGVFRNSTNFYWSIFEIRPFSTVFYRFLPGGFSPHVGIHYALGSTCSICSICSMCSVCSICSICSIGVRRFLKPYNVARNLHCLPSSTAPAPPVNQFLPRRRLRSTNFYRFLPRRGRRFTRKKPNKSTTTKHNSTNFYRAVF